MTAISIGTPAPDFELMTDSGQTFQLSRYRGHLVVLYFYPEDDTEGCTLESIEFTQLLPEFHRLGAVVLGISPDSVERHRSFRDKHNLAVRLAADPDRRAIEAYGLWQLKKMFGVEFLGVKRATVVVDAAGIVAAVVLASRIKGHAAKVLEMAKNIALA